MAESNGAPAKRLKEVADDLYRNQFYEAALGKYDQVLEVETENRKKAVIHSNKAQCLIQLKRFMDAISEAHSATKLDPSYCKGWARLAQAHKGMADFHSAARYWQKAIDALPAPKKRSEADIRLKEELQTNMEEAKRLTKVDLNGSGAAFQDRIEMLEQMPWVRATRIVEASELSGEELEATSSAWVMHGAYRDYKIGVDAIKALVKEENARGRVGDVVFKVDAIRHFVDGLLGDRRVLHLYEQQLWENLGYQSQVEAYGWDAWVVAGPSKILREAQERVRTQGWESTYQALATTIRIWIIRGTFAGYLQRNNSASDRWYSSAMELITGGRKIWSDLSGHDRNSVFSDAFKRAFSVLYLDSLLMSYGESPTPAKMKEIRNTARQVIDECEVAEETRRVLLADSLTRYRQYKLDQRERHAKGTSTDPAMGTPFDFAFLSACFVYPKAEALAARGFCEQKLALACVNDAKERSRRFLLCGQAYAAASALFNQDDEKHWAYARIALNALWKVPVPIGETLVLMRTIRESEPKMRRIWEHSQMSKGASSMFAEDWTVPQIAQYEAVVLEGLADGTLTEAHVASPTFH